jgi:hypothetical protein
MKYIIIALVIVLLIGCTQQQVETQEPVSEQETEMPEEIELPEVTEEEEPEQEAEQEQKPIEATKGISEDIQKIIEKGQTLDDYSFQYKSPESDEAYEVYVKSNKMKIIPPKIVNVEEGKFYNTIYLDTEAKTAEAYCLGYSRCSKNLGKVKDLDYAEASIRTPIEWLSLINQAEIIDERQMEGRSALYLQTDIGKITLEEHYGFIYRIEDGDKMWEFTDAAFNSVKDEDVTP